MLFAAASHRKFAASREDATFPGLIHLVTRQLALLIYDTHVTARWIAPIKTSQSAAPSHSSAPCRSRVPSPGRPLRVPHRAKKSTNCTRHEQSGYGFLRRGVKLSDAIERQRRWSCVCVCASTDAIGCEIRHSSSTGANVAPAEMVTGDWSRDTSIHTILL